MKEFEKIYRDALSYKLFGRNVNSFPSRMWFKFIATEEDIANWQTEKPEFNDIINDRVRTEKSVQMFTRDELKQLDGTMHFVPSLDQDIAALREIDITEFSLSNFKKTGNSYLTTCIFHDDKHPSCHVYPHKGFYCFSCGKSGTAIDWVMQEMGFSFRQAIDFLERYK